MIDKSTTASNARVRWAAPRLSKAAQIYRDLESGEISVRTTHEQLCSRYGADTWRDYKEALRDYGYDHGCLVLVDDENDAHYICMMEHFGRDIAQVEAATFFSKPLTDYINRRRSTEDERLPANVVHLPTRKPSRYSVYRLPVGDYSNDRQAFFDERAEFIWQTYA